MHARPVLAVLTSNLLLGLWAPGQNPRDGSTWKRVAIVNRLIESRFEKIPGPCGEGHRLGTRIRSFAWAAPKPESTVSTRDYHKAPKVQLLAIGNDIGEVMILWLLSPSEGFSRWDVRVLKIVDFSNSQRRLVSKRGKTSLLSHELHTRMLVNKLTWGQQWQNLNGSTRHWSGTLFIGSGDSTILLPLKLQMLSEGDDRYHIPVVNVGSPSFEANQPLGNPLTENLTQLSQHYPNLWNQVQDLRRLYSLQHALADDVDIAVWSVANHPVNVQHAVTCVSYHPSCMLEYTSSQSGICFVVVDEDGESAQNAGADRGDVQRQVKNCMDAYNRFHNINPDIIPNESDDGWSRRIYLTVLAAAKLQDDSLEKLRERVIEACSVCNEKNIQFNDLDKARCEKGHEFSRLITRLRNMLSVECPQLT